MRKLILSIVFIASSLPVAITKATTMKHTPSLL